MAVVSAVSTLVMSQSLGSRIWTATAAVQDTDAGSSVVITCVQSVTGTIFGSNPDTLTLDIYIDNGATLVHSFALTTLPGTQTATLFFTDTGLTGGALRAGTLRMRIHAVNTTGGVGGTYNIDTDLTNNTPPTGFTVTQHDQGWIRSTTTATTTLPGGGTLAYSDTLTATTTLGAAPYKSQTLNVALSPVGSTASAASTTVTFTTALGTVDNRFPASSAARTTAVTFPNATLTAAPWTTATLTETTRTVDPQITCTHYMQLDSVVFGTPPDGVTDTTHNVLSRLTSQEGDVAIRLTNANAAGLNGITYTHKLSNNANALQVGYDNAGLVSQTQGGALGWAPNFSAWASQLSGGAWDDVVTTTAPAGAVGLEVGATASLTLLAQDSRIGVLISVSPVAAIESRHLEAGDDIKVAMSVYNRDTHMRLTPDVAPEMCLLRYDRVNGWQYLAADATTWTNWASGACSPFTTVVEADPLSYAYTFSTTSGWTATDIVAVQVSFKVNGTPYGTYVSRELVGALNAHDAYAFDGPGFVGFPTR